MLCGGGRKPRPHEYMPRLEDAADNPAFTKARVACQDPEPGVGGRFRPRCVRWTLPVARVIGSSRGLWRHQRRPLGGGLGGH